MTWTSFHHRGEILHAVTAAADARRDGILPVDIDGVTETFGDEVTLLAALQLKWHTRLAGRIETLLMNQPLDLERAVESAWRDTADLMPGVRLVLDHYRAEPTDQTMAAAMAKATAKEQIMLAVMAGRASVGDVSAVAVGAQIEESARKHYRPAAVLVLEPVTHEHRRPSLFERLKAVVAA